MKRSHELRDPIHTFIRLDNRERRIIDTQAFQRLRDVQQLAFTNLVYPGATHKRFEHTLGVTELASRIFDVVVNKDNRHRDVDEIFPDDSQLPMWKATLRVAALCHDVGHMPFSHAAEGDLLPEGMDHESYSIAVIESDEMKEAIRASDSDFPLPVDKIAKIAVGPKHYQGEVFSPWEAILSEIITGNALGADRMDYLLRDSFHAGVAYGRFDHHRLIDTIRILPGGEGDSTEPQLGVESGGLQAAEALLLARYFMFGQVYMHPVRRAYDRHLVDFLTNWLPYGAFSEDLGSYLKMSDADVLVGIKEAARDPAHAAHSEGLRITERRHYRQVFSALSSDQEIAENAGSVLVAALGQEFGIDRFKHDIVPPKSGATDFPVETRDGRIASSLAMSEALNHIPPVSFDRIYAAPGIKDEVARWINENRIRVLKGGV